MTPEERAAHEARMRWALREPRYVPPRLRIPPDDLWYRAHCRLTDDDVWISAYLWENDTSCPHCALGTLDRCEGEDATALAWHLPRGPHSEYYFDYAAFAAHHKAIRDANRAASAA